MRWPEETSHGTGNPVFGPLLGDGPQPWRNDAEGEDPCRPYRSCPYCGSMHPEDVLSALRAGARLEMADWKYGFPHKFYLEGIPNPRAEELRVVSRTYSPEGDSETRAPAGPGWGKFYTRHLEEVDDPEAFRALADELETRYPEVRWKRDERGVKWSGRRPDGVR